MAGMLYVVLSLFVFCADCGAHHGNCMGEARNAQQAFLCRRSRVSCLWTCQPQRNPGNGPAQMPSADAGAEAPPLGNWVTTIEYAP